jgi:polyphenol oxidase
VRENVSRIQRVLGVDHLISEHQVHGTHIALVEGPCVEVDGDGMMTRHPHLGLMVKHADCQAAIFYDPIAGALANVHCGWRGNVQNLYGTAVCRMQEAFGSRPENILVGVSPSLGPENSQFIHYAQELPESFLPYQIKPCYFDLWAIARAQIEAAGILPHHIQIASICTYSNPEDFFSFRRDHRKTGNHATVAFLRDVC